MELNGWTSPQMLRRCGASARSARARRHDDRIMSYTDNSGNEHARPRQHWPWAPPRQHAAGTALPRRSARTGAGVPGL